MQRFADVASRTEAVTEVCAIFLGSRWFSDVALAWSRGVCECARQQEHLSMPENPSRHLLCAAMHCSWDCHGCTANCAPIATQQCTCSMYSISGMNSDLDATVVAQGVQALRSGKDIAPSNSSTHLPATGSLQCSRHPKATDKSGIDAQSLRHCLGA